MGMADRERSYRWLWDQVATLELLEAEHIGQRGIVALFLQGFAFGEHSVYWLR